MTTVAMVMLNIDVELITALLRNRVATLRDLADSVGASVRTVQRRLNVLEALGAFDRVHTGRGVAYVLEPGYAVFDGVTIADLARQLRLEI